MRKIVTIAYDFEELSEKAQQKAIDNMRDTALDYDWWEQTYEDADNVDVKLTGFDIGRGDYCEGEFKTDALHTATKIMEDHGEHCGTYKTAKAFVDDREALLAGAELDEYGDYSEEVSEELEELEDGFKKTLMEDYLKMLRDDHEYMTSDEYVREYIIGNDYEFTEDGKRIRG
jgi:hypothetical protein